MRPCDKQEAVEFVKEHHSRLPNTQRGPWKFSFGAYCNQKMVAAALWNNPSARTLPNDWLELRRMACSADAPRNTASHMLGKMARYFERYHPDVVKLISYQDVDVHAGTIYKAANWFAEYYSRPRNRDRSKNRTGTTRKYRSDINTASVAASGKIRWSYYLQQDPSLALKQALAEKVIADSIKPRNPCK